MRSMATIATERKTSAVDWPALTGETPDGRLGIMEGKKWFWTDARRALVARTLANLFLLLIGASATGEVIGTWPWWLRTLVAVGIATTGMVAVIVMPDRNQEEN
mgnify:CR=1